VHIPFRRGDGAARVPYVKTIDRIYRL